MVIGKSKYRMYVRFLFYLQIMVASLYLARCLKQHFPLFLILHVIRDLIRISDLM